MRRYFRPGDKVAPVWATDKPFRVERVEEYNSSAPGEAAPTQKVYRPDGEWLWNTVLIRVK